MSSSTNPPDETRHQGLVWGFRTAADAVVTSAKNSANDTTASTPPAQPEAVNPKNPGEITVFDGTSALKGRQTLDPFTNTNDKVPVLGDIPLLSRLFQSRPKPEPEIPLLGHFLLTNNGYVPVPESAAPVPNSPPTDPRSLQIEASAKFIELPASVPFDKNHFDPNHLNAVPGLHVLEDFGKGTGTEITSGQSKMIVFYANYPGPPMQLQLNPILVSNSIQYYLRLMIENPAGATVNSRPMPLVLGMIVEGNTHDHEPVVFDLGIVKGDNSSVAALPAGSTSTAQSSAADGRRRLAIVTFTLETSTTNIGTSTISASTIPRDGNIPSTAAAKTDGFLVAGEVNRPGNYLLPTDGSTTVSQAVQQAGGFTDWAVNDKVHLYHYDSDGKKQEQTVDVEAVLGRGERDKDVKLQSNDIIVVDKTFFKFN